MEGENEETGAGLTPQVNDTQRRQTERQVPLEVPALTLALAGQTVPFGNIEDVDLELTINGKVYGRLGNVEALAQGTAKTTTTTGETVDEVLQRVKRLENAYSIPQWGPSTNQVGFRPEFWGTPASSSQPQPPSAPMTAVD
ncbi:hypothetical protein PIB30_076014 [Stylosanthes scabra]|uniref:Uncharacterized protein n=1 Tax=Stylosanthes scabra TaxID=79078 RepID=A0ABU6RQY9_9FABA|nr:hypothetical protein [Stylosanthes scabra]